jgi:hypothetical protein
MIVGYYVFLFICWVEIWEKWCQPRKHGKTPDLPAFSYICTRSFEMKKRICVLLLTFAVMGAAFAQEQPEEAQAETKAVTKVATKRGRENSIALDVFPLFNGFIAADIDAGFTDFAISASFERLVVPHFSIGGNMDIQFLRFEVKGGDDRNGSYFGMSAEGRYYPTENFEKFFLGATLGFYVVSRAGKTNYKYVNDSIQRVDDKFLEGSLTVSLKMGYKYITKSGFYMESSLAYALSKQQSIDGIVIPTPIGWQGGLRFGFSI